MAYFQWKRRIDACGMFLLLLLPVFLLILSDGMIQYRKENFVPVEIKYPLSEVPENQAVLVQENCIPGIAWNESTYDVVVNKEGRWKLIDYSIVDRNEMYVEGLTSYEFFDAVLRDERIPWQKKKIGMNPVLLERALNMKEVKFKRGSSANLSSYRMDKPHIGETNGYLIDISSKRQYIDYCIGDPVKSDYTLLYIQCKMKEIATLGLRTRRDNRR